MISFTPFEPTFLTIGFLQFRYYGLMYAIAFLLCYVYLNFLRKNKKVEITSDHMWDCLFWGTLGLILGARIGYVLVYNFPYYFSNPLKIFAVWEGGMSFHGGLLGVILFGYILCTIKKLPFLTLTDFMIFPLIWGVVLGRLGNFINGELFGRGMEEGSFFAPLGMYFEKGGEILRHPVQLYEMGAHIVSFFILFWVFKKTSKRKAGTILFLFLILYGIFRFFIEFVREPDPQLGLFFGWITMGQILCAFMVLAGIIGISWLYKKKKTMRNYKF